MSTNRKMDINKCAARNCENKVGEAHGKTFHRFPTWNSAIFKEWVSKSGRTANWKPAFDVLCSDHFEESCYDVIEGVKYIKADAVPTLYLPKDSGEEPQIMSVISLDNIFKSSANEGTDPLQVFHEKIDEFCQGKRNRIRKKEMLQLLLSFKRFAINQQKIKVVLNRQRLLRRKMMQTAMIMMLLAQQKMDTNS